MPEERARILEMLREGKITVEEADGLLDALPEPSSNRGRGRGEPLVMALASRFCLRLARLRIHRHAR